MIFAIALAASIAAAHLLYKFVEAPTHRLSRRIRLVPELTPSQSPAAALEGALV